MTGTSLLGTPPPYKVVGVVHLPPLPGSARGGQARDLPALLEVAQRDAATYAVCGVDALIVENFGDAPFARGAVSQYTVAALTLAAAVVRAETGLPVGVNVLRNDVAAAVSVAAAAGGSFVRANVYAGAAVTDQGLIEGCAEEVQLLIRRLGASIAVWADVDVKHAAPLARRPLGEMAADAVERGLASAIIVTGRGTGQPVEWKDLRAVRAALPHTPVYVGSGATPELIPDLLLYADGVIVGTAAKVDGEIQNAVDPGRVRSLVRAARGSTGMTSMLPPR
jgi:membrane complex biogenesis BtpA family protein